jgi:hypothetical protein
VRRRLLDEDNLCEKYHVDCCRYAGLIPGDSPAEIQIQTRQRKAARGEEEHTQIDIFRLKPDGPELLAVPEIPEIPVIPDLPDLFAPGGLPEVRLCTP